MVAAGGLVTLAHRQVLETAPAQPFERALAARVALVAKLEALHVPGGVLPDEEVEVVVLEPALGVKRIALLDVADFPQHERAAPLAIRCSMAPSCNPASRSTSRVCSPWRGAWRRYS